MKKYKDRKNKSCFIPDDLPFLRVGVEGKGCKRPDLCKTNLHPIRIALWYLLRVELDVVLIHDVDEVLQPDLVVVVVVKKVQDSAERLL